MPMDPQLRGQLRQFCVMQFSSTATVNSFGEILGGSVATVACRVETRERYAERQDGTYVISRQPLIVVDGGTVTPTFETRIWIPGTNPAVASQARHPRFIECNIDEFGGVDHWEIELG